MTRAHVSSVGVSAPLPAASGGWMGPRGSWGRLAERPVVNARRLGALKARQFLSPGRRPGNGIVNEIEPYRGGIPTVHGRCPGLRDYAPSGLRRQRRTSGFCDGGCRRRSAALGRRIEYKQTPTERTCARRVPAGSARPSRGGRRRNENPAPGCSGRMPTLATPTRRVYTVASSMHPRCRFLGRRLCARRSGLAPRGKHAASVLTTREGDAA